MKTNHFKFVILNRFLASSVEMFGIDKAMHNWSRCVKTEKPVEIPLNSVRDGHYKIRPAKGITKYFTCINGVWYLDGTYKSDFEVAPLHPGDKVLADLAKVPRKYLSKAGRRTLDYWEFQTLLRETGRRSAMESLRILGKRKKKKRTSQVVK